MSKSPGQLTSFPMVCSPPNQLRTRWPGFSTAAGPRAAAEGVCLTDWPYFLLAAQYYINLYCMSNMLELPSGKLT